MKGGSFHDMYMEAVAAPLPPTPRRVFLDRVMRATGCSYDTAVNWSTRRKLPRRAAREKLAAEFGVDADTLFPLSDA